VPFGDSKGLARATANLIQNSTLRATLGRAAQARAREKFSASVIVPQYETLYRRVCG
jgi:glycosyltransferase involved in cell wall biosynthesis